MMVMKPAWFGISDSSLPARISFLAVGIWWIGFAQVTFITLMCFQKNQKRLYFKGFKELVVVLKV
jgi:UMF1 family MFS transporter